MRAAVLRDAGRPLTVEEVEIAEPAAGEVLVRLAASGVCHSDYHVVVGEWRTTMPIVLGHEGAGVVAAVGPGVDRLAVGDPVVLAWMPGCGDCAQCAGGRPQLCVRSSQTVDANTMPDGTTRLRQGDEIVYSYLGVGSFGEYAVVAENAAIPVRAGLPLDRAAMIGCAVATGFGAAVKTVEIPVGASVAVLGCGGVGLSTLQGAAARSADPIIALDVHPDKLEVARRFGATHAIDARRCDVGAAVGELTAGLGVDYAFEAIGLKATIEQAVELLAPGGTAVIVGMTPDGVAAEFDPTALASRERRIVGCNYGSCNPRVDFPRLLTLYERGRIDLDAMITRRIALDDVNAALATIADGTGIRSVVVYPA